MTASTQRASSRETDGFLPCPGACPRPIPLGPPNLGDSKNCSHLATQADAQEWHDFYFPFYGDIANLDGDNDGEACESLP